MRAAIDIDGRPIDRSTSSERSAVVSLCATCCRTEFARARPSRLLTTARCSISKSATATWFDEDTATSALSRARSSRSPSGSPVRASK